ncbi:hypothetical protein Mgra_00004337 [Meloidogyne graminicola]|uniref:Uncharacterized protein n=1 Tax=Meloidogyne graminicola TaxID=189291 RepID=A0A8S9ZT80_9BILA|nr:hypothetical protein Mgra_00004337 [Meloidogyne graminicola]
MKFNYLFIFSIFINLINLIFSVISNTNINGVNKILTNIPLNGNKINNKTTKFGNFRNFSDQSKTMFKSLNNSRMPLASISKEKIKIPHAINNKNDLNEGFLPWQLTCGYDCLQSLALGFEMIFDFSEDEEPLEMYKKAGKSFKQRRMKLYLKYLNSIRVHSTLINQINKMFNIMSNQDIESQIGINETKYPKVVSRLRCWAVTIFLVNTLLALNEEEKSLLYEKFNIINTKLLIKMMAKDLENSDIMPQIKKTGLFVIDYLKTIFPFKNFYDGEFLKEMESSNEVKECFDDECIIN